MKNTVKIAIILGVFVDLINPLLAYSQGDEKKFNHYNDTLIILGDKYIDTYKILISRDELLDNDTLKINQKGFKIISFEMKALALGSNITLTSNSNIINKKMKEEIIKGRVKYKFIYLKNIFLQNRSGRKFSPSTKDIKIVFTD